MPKTELEGLTIALGKAIEDAAERMNVPATRISCRVDFVAGSFRWIATLKDTTSVSADAGDPVAALDLLAKVVER